ncbi:MAG TPA: hypothetical protein VKT77_23250 [Chthonomonadaceae bacterium]|nr:hypothetical protein [Chthonomonadaceae bacterium]
MSSAAAVSPHGVEVEIDECARLMFVELTAGAPRSEAWYRWYLCERHGGPPLLDPFAPPRQVAYWDGDDIVIASRAPVEAVANALPEELAHRLSGVDALRFESMNYRLRHATRLSRAEFQERVGQRVAQLFDEA